MRTIRSEKYCPRCGEVLPASDFYYSPKFGYGAYCRPCTLAYNREYDKRDYVKQARRDYVERNREQLRAYNTAYVRERRRLKALDKQSPSEIK